MIELKRFATELSLAPGLGAFRSRHVRMAGLETVLSLPGERATRLSERIIEWRGRRLAIRLQKGPEPIGGTLLSWAEKRGIAIQQIQPGKLRQNPHVARCDRTVRHDLLEQYLFRTIMGSKITLPNGSGRTLMNGRTWGLEA